MDITKSGIVNIIIITLLSIPLDEQILHFSADFIHAHPMLSKLFTSKKTQANNKAIESKNTNVATDNT